MAAPVSANPALPTKDTNVTPSTFGSKLQKMAQVIFSKYTFYAVGALLIGSALALIAMHSFVILQPSMILLICGFGAIAIGYVVGFDNESPKVDNSLPRVRDPLADIVYGKIDDKKIESAKGKVIGIANQGNTCYIEAFLQMIINTPTIVEFLLKKPDGFQPLSDFVIQYQKDCQANRETTEADVENIRNWMMEFQTRKELNLISEDKQEDAGAELDLFDAMLLSAKENKVKKVPLVGHVNRSVVLDNGKEYYGRSCKGEDLGRLSIPATENVPFTELMNRSDLNASTITNTDDPEVKITCPVGKKEIMMKKVRDEKQFEKAPESLTVWTQRFVNIPESGSVRLEKLSGPICVDDNYVLPAKNIKRASRGVSYELNSIIAHIGGSIDGGHYVAVVRKKVENVWKWYCCNDATAYEISKEELEIFKSYGYVFSFVKST